MSYPPVIETQQLKIRRQTLAQNHSLPVSTTSTVVRVARTKSIYPVSNPHEHPPIEHVESFSSNNIQPKTKSTTISVKSRTRSNSIDSLNQNVTKSEVFDDFQKSTVSIQTISTKIRSNSLSNINHHSHSTNKISPIYNGDPLENSILSKTSSQSSYSNSKISSDRQAILSSIFFNDSENEDGEIKRRQQRRDGCFANCCSCCCLCYCLLATLLSLLLLGGLTALLVLLLTNKSTTTTITTVKVTDITINMNTTTTTVCTTSTTSESTTTTSETTTSVTTETTTSVTTDTSTTSIMTTTTTTTASTVTITSNTCTSGWQGATILYHCTNCPDIAPYHQYTYTYTAISNVTRIAFAFREDSGAFALDSVSVRSTTAPSVELISNNGFETGTLSSWSYCNPLGATAVGEVVKNSDNFQHLIYIYQAQSGTHFYADGAVGAADYLFQTFPTTIGTIYTISFWLYNRGSGTASSADVIISI